MEFRTFASETFRAIFRKKDRWIGFGVTSRR
jgi:hypothetical protein